jgi:hypothetical protein
MLARAWQLFVAFLGAKFYFCPHDWGRFCPKCRRYHFRMALGKAGLQEIVKARKGKSVQPVLDKILPRPAEQQLEDAMEEEDLELFKELEDAIEPEPEGEVCPACGEGETRGGVCELCGHYEGEEVPYEPPRKDEPEE